MQNWIIQAHVKEEKDVDLFIKDYVEECSGLLLLLLIESTIITIK